MPMWFKKLDPLAKLLAGLVIVGSSIFTFGMTVGGWREIPIIARTNQQDIRNLEVKEARDVQNIQRVHQTLEDDVGNILCILTQLEGANPLDCI